MDDLISRQAAIDVILRQSNSASVRDLCEYVREHDLQAYRCQGLIDAIIAVIALPSAQPEIVRCRDCKHRIVNEHYGERGYLKLKAECEWDTGDPYGLGRNAEDDEWFCADGERREDDVDPSDR